MPCFQLLKEFARSVRFLSLSSEVQSWIRGRRKWMDLHIMEDKKKSSERNSCQLRWEQFYFAPIHIWNNLQVVMMGGFPPFPPSCCQKRDSTYNNNLFYVGFAGIAVKVLLSSGEKKILNFTRTRRRHELVLC